MRELISLENGRYVIRRSCHTGKGSDLCTVQFDTRTTEKNVDASRTVFKKDEIRKIAEKIDYWLQISQTVRIYVFVPDGDYAAYIEEKCRCKKFRKVIL